jgi:glycosyltransferase involved in cell wall biosynthesis
MSQDRLGLLTIDPESSAGVRSVTQFTFRHTSREGYDPYIIFNAVPWNDCVTVRSLVREGFDPVYEEGIYEDMEGIKIGRIFPEARILNYVSNRRYWKRALASADKYLGLGGHCLSSLPAALSGKSFGCWIGTTLYDEQAARNHQSVTREMRDYLTFPIVRHYEKYVLQRANSILTQSEYTKYRIQELYNISEDRIEVIPYPVDVEKFKPDSTERSKEVVLIGRVNASRKNVPLLIRAFERVKSRVPNATLTLIGQEPNGVIKKEVRDAGIQDSVKFAGYVDDIVQPLTRASAFVLPSNQEGLGIAGLEAQACGTPVIATKCGGPEDYVEHGANGFLVPRNDESALSDRIVEILEDDELRSRLSKRSRQNVVDNYSHDSVAADLNQAVNELPKAVSR